MDYYGENDWRNYLSHHGILGQKWGVRRFQAYGSGGYDRKGGKTGKIVGKARQSSTKTENVEPLSAKEFKKKNNLLISTDYVGTKRENDAADLGLKALLKDGVLNTRDHDIDPEDPSDWREWFMIEDQTIGYGLIADQVNQGKTKTQINSLIKDAQKAMEKDYFLGMSKGYFELNEFAYDSYGDRFIDSCIEIRNRK